VAAAPDGAALRIAAHSLKGAARTVGANAVEQAAEDAELSASNFLPATRDTKAEAIAAALGPALAAARGALAP
jgi:HPt (histidine-containing phosphotransfer) domain-containing protein